MIERRLFAAVCTLSLLASACTENPTPTITPTRPTRPTSTPIPTLTVTPDTTPIPLARRVYEKKDQLSAKEGQEYTQRWMVVSGILDPVLESDFLGATLADTRFPTRNEDLPVKVPYVDNYVASSPDGVHPTRWKLRIPSMSKAERFFIEAFFNSSNSPEKVIATYCAKIEDIIQAGIISSLQMSSPSLVKRFGQAVDDSGIFKKRPDWQSAKKTESDGCKDTNAVIIEGEGVNRDTQGKETRAEYAVSTGGAIKVSITTLQPTLANKN